MRWTLLITVLTKNTMFKQTTMGGELLNLEPLLRTTSAIHNFLLL